MTWTAPWPKPKRPHRKAFNRSFADAGLDWLRGRKRYRELLAVLGGKEHIRRFVEQADPTQADRADFDEWVACSHRARTIHYASMMAAGEIELRPGVERLIREAHGDGLRLAIATTTSMVNLEARLTRRRAASRCAGSM